MSEREDSDALDAWLRNLGAETQAPPRMRARILRELRSRGAIRRSPRWRWVQRGMAAALVLGAILAIVRALSSPDSGGGPIPRYVLILDTVSANYSGMSPEEAAPLAEAYTRWLEEIEARGSLKESYYLASTESPSGLDAVSGIVVIEAASLEEVEAIVDASPHVRRGGTIRIRELALER